jgi:phosphoglycerate kinase
MAWNTLDDMDLNGKRVLVRVDINVPVEDGQVTDTTRIEKIVPTVHDILERGGRPMLLAHFGRPKGKVVPDLSLSIVLHDLQRLLGRDVTLAQDFDGAEAHSENVVLFENIRFHPGEEANDPEFAARLAKLGDIYVNDAFSCAHRAHASSVGIADHLPTFAGLALERELDHLA